MDAAKILVVDDDAVMRRRLRASLQPHGHEVHEAATADEGLELARALAPDVIFLDFVLPDADGLVLLREIRRAGVDAAVVALTGSSSPEVAYRFLRAGAADFLSKDRLAGGDARDAVRRALMLRRVDVKLSTRRVEVASRGREEGPSQTLLDDPAEESEAPTRALRVLVIDDTDVARAAVRGVLGREGWTIEEAPDLKRALGMVGGAHDVVLLDYLLPDVDGVEALAQLRDAGLSAPVIGLSGHGSEDVAARFLTAGAIDFLPKDDLSEARLVHAIRRAVALSGVDAFR